MTDLQHAVWLLATVTTGWVALQLVLTAVKVFNTIYALFTYHDSIKLIEKYLDKEKGDGQR
jgi:hypothetical protein